MSLSCEHRLLSYNICYIYNKLTVYDFKSESSLLQEFKSAINKTKSIDFFMAEIFLKLGLT